MESWSCLRRGTQGDPSIRSQGCASASSPTLRLSRPVRPCTDPGSLHPGVQATQQRDQWIPSPFSIPLCFSQAGYPHSREIAISPFYYTLPPHSSSGARQTSKSVEQTLQGCGSELLLHNTYMVLAITYKLTSRRAAAFLHAVPYICPFRYPSIQVRRRTGRATSYPTVDADCGPHIRHIHILPEHRTD